MANFPITESYTNNLGEFVGYDTANSPLIVSASNVVTATTSGVNNVLTNQEHIDIRGFVPSGIVSTLTYDMLNLGADNMAFLNNLNMSQLSNSSTYGDQWTAGTVAPIVSLGNIVGLTWTLASGINSTTSIQPPVNLSTGFQPNDYICLSLPQLPLPLINQSQSYVSLSDGVNTTQLFFNQSFAVLTSGNTCAAWHYSQLGAVTAPTVVNIVIDALAACTVKITGLRLISQNWSPLTLDVNTAGQFLRPITTQSGTIPAVAYPAAWRCAVPQGIEDPRPVNSSFGALFYTGSMTNNSTINIYQRGRSEAVITQLDLDYAGPGIGYLQSGLDALGAQPDFGTSYFQPSTQGTLNLENQGQLNLQQQWQLERINDVTNQYWIQSAITWQPNSGFTVGLNNYTSVSGVLYSATASGMHANSYYFFNADVENETVRLTLDPVSTIGLVGSGRLFDSGIIQNNLIRRTAGRIGWGAVLGDGDAFVKTFLSQSLMFAEYRSKYFQSRTPVKGASLTVGATPSLQLFTGVVPFGNASVTTNFAISNSTEGSFQTTTNGPVQGISSNVFTVTDFNHFEIEFDMYIPSATLNVTQLACGVFNSFGALISLPLGQLMANTWTSYTIPAGAFTGLLPGPYSFSIFTIANTPITFYIDNINVAQTVIGWSARSAFPDPWGANQIPWVAFGDLLNDTSNGILFEPYGTFLQVRAQAFAQNASIGSYYLTPNFATLGQVIL